MRKTRLAVATAATVAATLTMTPAATANTAERSDARGDAPRYVDLAHVVIDNGDANPELAIIRIRVAGKLRTGGAVTVWFNRDPSDAGPELKLTGVVDSEYAMHRVHTWNGPGEAASCDYYTMKQFADRHGVRVRINRSCLGNRPVRIAIRAEWGLDEDRRVDWFQGRRTFLDGVLH